jgi:hypothetical protein
MAAASRSKSFSVSQTWINIGPNVICHLRHGRADLTMKNSTKKKKTLIYFIKYKPVYRWESHCAELPHQQKEKKKKKNKGT